MCTGHFPNTVNFEHRQSFHSYSSHLFRCECKADDDTLSTNHIRSHLKNSALMNSNSNLHHPTPHQRLMAQLIRIENQKKGHLSSSTLASLLQTPIQTRPVSTDLTDPFQQKVKRFKASHKKTNHVRSIFLCLCQTKFFSSLFRLIN